MFCLQLINKGKGEALRIRAILRSLVPTEDLVGIISIPLRMPIINKGIDVTIFLINFFTLTINKKTAGNICGPPCHSQSVRPEGPRRRVVTLALRRCLRSKTQGY